MNSMTPQEDLMSLQIQLEEQMTQRGAEKYLRDVSKAIQSGREESTAYGTTILSRRVEVLSKAIAEWLEATGKGRAGNNATAYKKVKDASPDLLAFLTLKAVLSGISSTRTVQFVAVTIGTFIEDELRYAVIRENERKQYEKIIVGAKKRTTGHYRHMYAIRQADRLNDGWQKWTRVERLHVGIKLLDLLMAHVGLVELTHQKVVSNPIFGRSTRALGT